MCPTQDGRMWSGNQLLAWCSIHVLEMSLWIVSGTSLVVGWPSQVAIKRRGRVDSNFVVPDYLAQGICLSPYMVARG